MFKPNKKFGEETGLLDMLYGQSIPGKLAKTLGKDKEFKRIVAGGLLTVPREALELSRMITNPSLERVEKQEEFLEDYLGYMVGSENVTMTQRGEEGAGGYAVADIAQPESTTGQLTRMGLGIVGGIFGAKKITVPAKAIGKKLGIGANIPAATTKLGRAASYTAKQASAGALGSQIGFNPYDEQLGEIIAEFMPEGEGYYEDVREYLLADRQTKTQLQNRIDLLGEGIFIGTGMAAAGGMFKGGKYLKDTEASEKFVSAFRDTLDKVSAQGKEGIDNFMSKLDYKNLDAAQVKATLEYRQKDVIDGKLVDMGDIDAIKPSKYTRWISDINLQFSSSNILRKLENFRTKLVTTKGGRGRQLNEKYLKTENLKEKWTDNINNVAYNLESSLDDLVRKVSDNKWFGSNRKANKAKFLQKLNDVLYTDFRTNTIVGSKRGISVGKRQQPTFEKELQKNFPKEMWDDIRTARRLQDNLSDLMTETGSLTTAQKKIYKDSLGFYVRKSYKLYEDSGYVPTQDIKNEARVYLREQIQKENPTLSNAQLITDVETELNRILNVNRTTDSFRVNLDSFDKIKKEILNGRKVIPKPISNLLGEIEDPIQSLIFSTTKLSKFVEDTKFYNEAFEDGSEIYFKSKPSGAFTEQIGEGYGKLSKTYTTPEMKEYFSNHQKFGEDLLQNNEFSIKGGIGWAYRNTLLLKGLSQAAKTVYSHATHVKNVIGGNHMSLANGVNTLSPTKGWNIIKVLRAKTRRDKDAQAYHEELSGRGLLNKGTVTRDLQGLAKDNAKVQKGFIIGKLDWAFEKVGFKKVAKAAQDFYVGTDDFYKLNMYESEQIWLNDFQKALPEGNQFNKYRQTTEELKDESALIVRTTLPNYDLVPEILKDLRRVPFVGTFFSFMSESVRISQGSLMRSFKEINTGKQLIKEGADDAGKIIRNRGTLRLASFVTMAGVGGKAMEEGSKAVYGVTTDVIDAARDMLPDYMQNANLFITVKEDGTPAVANISSWDAYDFPKKPFQVISNKILNTNNLNEDILSKDILTTLVNEMATPFIGESLIQEQLSNYFLSDGMTDDKRLMRNPFNRVEQYDNSGSKLENRFKQKNLNILMANLFKTVLPGSVDRAIDWSKTLNKDQTSFDQDIYPVDQAIKFLTGWGVQPLNKEYVENVFTFKARDYAKDKGFRRTRLYNAITSDFDSDVFINNYLEENREYAKSYAKAHKLIKSGNTFNLNVNQLLKDAGFSSRDRIYLINSSKYKPLGLTKEMKRRLKEEAGLSVSESIKKDINIIDGELSNISIIYDPENYKATAAETFKELRDEYKTGGIVPKVEEDPADRTNQFTGISYNEEIERNKKVDGGPVNEEGLTRIYDEDQGLGTVSPVVDLLLGGFTYKSATGAINVAREISEKAMMPKTVSHSSSVKGLKEIKSSNSRVSKPNEGLQSAIYTKGKGVSSEYLFQGNQYPIDTSDISSIKNIINFGKNKVINSNKPPKKFVKSLDGAIKNAKKNINSKSSRKEAKELINFKNSLGKKDYISDVGPTARKFLDNNNVKVVRTINRLEDEPTYILIEDMVKVKGK